MPRIFGGEKWLFYGLHGYLVVVVVVVAASFSDAFTK